MHSMRLSRHEIPDTYDIKMDKRGHALLYYQNKLILVLNAKDTKSLKLRIEEKNEQETQMILCQYVNEFNPYTA